MRKQFKHYLRNLNGECLSGEANYNFYYETDQTFKKNYSTFKFLNSADKLVTR
jgi:hypothetical protein